MSDSYDILIVDDEPVLIGATKRIFLPENLTVDDAPSADVALDKLQQRRYRLVLSDLMLPGAQGIELLQAIRKSRQDIPVVMITGYATLGSAIESFKNGAFDFLPKPFDVAELLAVTRRALKFSELDPAARQNLSPAEFARHWQVPAEDFTELLTLGQHAWVGLMRNGSARIGAGESFRGVGDSVRAVELPKAGEDTLQGNECARVITEDGLVHRLWAPLSGTIFEANHAWDSDAGSPESVTETWLLGVVPSNLENESGNLTAR